jgi:hypothetical protein
MNAMVARLILYGDNIFFCEIQTLLLDGYSITSLQPLDLKNEMKLPRTINYKNIIPHKLYCKRLLRRGTP